MRDRLVAQFKRPHGVLGRLAGWIMAHRESNVRRNAWVVSLLDIEPHHRVLEIGCGPGLALQRAAELASEGWVVGVDHSELMVQTAAERNAAAVRSGRVAVVHGTVETGIAPGHRFDRVYAVNVVQFWDSPVETLVALRRAMEPGGTIAIALQPRNKGATDEDARQAALQNQALLHDAGFSEIRVEMLELNPMVACVLGRA